MADYVGKIDFARCTKGELIIAGYAYDKDEPNAYLNVDLNGYAPGFPDTPFGATTANIQNGGSLPQDKHRFKITYRNITQEVLHNAIINIDLGVVRSGQGAIDTIQLVCAPHNTRDKLIAFDLNNDGVFDEKDLVLLKAAVKGDIQLSENALNVSTYDVAEKPSDNDITRARDILDGVTREVPRWGII